jgi:hypothetical protein
MHSFRLFCLFCLHVHQLKKEAEEKKKAELDMLFQAAIVQPKVPPGQLARLITAPLHE